MTKVELCNKALILLGCKPITSLSGQSKESVICNQVVDTCIRKVLSEHEWSAVTAYTTLPLTTRKPPFKYSYIYSLPQDYVRKIEISVDDYEKVGREIFTNAEKIELKYIRIPKSTEDLDVWLNDSIVLHIAYEISYPLLGKDKETQMFYGKYRAQLLEAISRDQEEKAEQVEEEGEWV